jgi:hypothetical protein
MVRVIGAACAMALLAGCTTTAGREDGGGNVLSNLFFYGGTTVPPAAAAVREEIECPSVDVAPGGAAIQVGGGGGQYEALRHQISIGTVARECTVADDGSVRVRVGVQGRVLIGPAGGSGGRFDAPVSVVVRSGSRVFAQRARRVPVTIPSGDTQGSFAVVEDGIVVPASVGENFEIVVALGGSPAAQPRRRGRG